MLAYISCTHSPHRSRGTHSRLATHAPPAVPLGLPDISPPVDRPPQLSRATSRAMLHWARRPKRHRERRAEGVLHLRPLRQKINTNTNTFACNETRRLQLLFEPRSRPSGRVKRYHGFNDCHTVSQLCKYPSIAYRPIAI